MKSKTIILDSYAMLVFLRNESCANDVEKLFIEAKKESIQLFMNTINLGEVIYISLREKGMEYAIQVETEIYQLPIHLVENDWDMIKQAAYIKWKKPMSYADCFAVATAQKYQAAVATGDVEFKAVDGEIEIMWLPKK